MQERQLVVISEDVLNYLAELSHLLFKNGYFDYFENALQYVDDICDEIFAAIETLPAQKNEKLTIFNIIPSIV